MGWLIWPGAITALLGIGGLGFCIRGAVRVRSQMLNDDQMKAKLQGLAALNMAALAVATIGLMVVVIGILLG